MIPIFLMKLQTPEQEEIYEKARLIVEESMRREALVLMRCALAGSDAERKRIWDESELLFEYLHFRSDEPKYKGGN